MGNIRFFFQESVLYSGRVFAPEYFLSPMPLAITQAVFYIPGSPWSQTEDSNIMLGFMLDYRDPQWYGYGQILIDDLNVNYVLGTTENYSPWKVAWSTGLSHHFPFGTLGILHAGALQHVFPADPSRRLLRLYRHPVGALSRSRGRARATICRQLISDTSMARTNLAFRLLYRNRFYPGDDLPLDLHVAVGIRSIRQPISNQRLARAAQGAQTSGGVVRLRHAT